MGVLSATPGAEANAFRNTGESWVKGMIFFTAASSRSSNSFWRWPVNSVSSGDVEGGAVGPATPAGGVRHVSSTRKIIGSPGNPLMLLREEKVDSLSAEA